MGRRGVVFRHRVRLRIVGGMLRSIVYVFACGNGEILCTIANAMLWKCVK